jgi:hypothetical protein
MIPAVTHALAFECHGTVVGVRTDADALLALVLRHLPPGARPCRPTRVDVSYAARIELGEPPGIPPHVILVRCISDGAPVEIARTPDIHAAAALLMHDAEFQVALHAPLRLFVHAAAVAWEGGVIVIPGPSFSGKSALAAALVRAGAEYYSDEYAVLDDEGFVHPFARRLRLRGADGAPVRTVLAAELGGTTGTAPLPLAMVVATSFRAGARWRPRRMTPGQLALTLLQNAVVARTRPAHALDRVARAARGDPVGLRGVRGDADDAAHMLLLRASGLRDQPRTPSRAGSIAR